MGVGAAGLMGAAAGSLLSLCMQQLQGRQCQGPEAVLCRHSKCEGQTIGCCCMTADS